MKFKESVKNLVLVVLVVSSMTLTWKIWFSEELWPDGYNSFPYEENIFSSIGQWFLSHFQPGEGNTAFDYNQLFYPKQIRLNQDGRKELLTPSSRHFSQLNQQIGQLLKIFMDSSTVVTIDEEELRKAYRAPSVYVDYYHAVPIALLNAYFAGNLPDALQDALAFDHLAFSLGNETQTMTLYLTDSETKINYKLIAQENAEELRETVAEVLASGTTGGLSSNNFPFSFESNFDKPSQEIGMRMPIDSYTVISLIPTPIKAAESELLLNIGDSQTATTFNRLIEAFSINLGSARRFTDSVGAYNYVENFAALTIHPDGLLEYSATNAEKGIQLEGGSDAYELVIGVGEFVNRINSLLPAKINTLGFHRVEEINRNQYQYTFYYLADGIPVWMNQPLPNGKVMESAVEVIVEDNHIVSYRQKFVNIRTTETVLASVATIDAMDAFYNAYQGKMDDVQIDDFYTIYQYDDGTVAPKLVFRLSDGEKVILDVTGREQE